MINKTIVLIAAHDKHRVIGKNGKMPWHFPDDLKHFRQVTEGHAVIMGRKTFEAIGKPLPNRQNIVLSRRKDLSFEGCDTAHTLQEAIEKAQDHLVFIIGGAQIYSQAIELADCLILTEIDTEFEGDAYFPEFDKSRYHASIKKELTKPYSALIKQYKRQK